VYQGGAQAGADAKEDGRRVAHRRKLADPLARRLGG
jgi:hypothetical protein